METHTINQNSNEEHLTFEQDLIKRYKQRLRSLWARPNPYYKKGEYPTEYQEINQKIKQLEKITKNK